MADVPLVLADSRAADDTEKRSWTAHRPARKPCAHATRDHLLGSIRVENDRHDLRHVGRAVAFDSVEETGADSFAIGIYPAVRENGRAEQQKSR